MPTYIVRKNPASRDGSTLGASQVVVTASDPTTAKTQGAQQLGVPASQVSVESFLGRVGIND